MDEIKKDRDQRVGSLRQDIDELTGRLDKLDADHASLKVQHKSLQEENTRLNNDYAVLGKNLHLSNEVRQAAEENLVELQKQYKSIKEAFVERDLLMVNYRRKFEDEQKRLTDCERRADSLEITKKALEKQNDIQRKQLLDKIMQQSEQIAAEKDTREIWINRYEKEQKAHITTHTEYMTLRGEM